MSTFLVQIRVRNTPAPTRGADMQNFIEMYKTYAASLLATPFKVCRGLGLAEGQGGEPMRGRRWFR